MFLIIENSFCSKGQAKGSELTISIAKKETSMNIPHKQAYLHIPLVTYRSGSLLISVIRRSSSNAKFISSGVRTDE